MKYKLLLLLLVFAKGFSQNAVLDTTFGVNGKVTTSFGSLITGIGDLAIQSDGKIIALGNINNYLGFGLARYNVDGSLDSSFGTNGKVINTDFFQCRSSGFKLTSDGKIIVAASRRLGQFSGEDILLIKYNSNGTLDSSFGQNGYVVTDLNSSIEYTSDISIQSDNKIIVSSLRRKIIRYTDLGALDTTFGVNGIVTLSPLGTNISPSLDSNEYINDVRQQSNGKIIISGITDRNHVPEDWDSYLLRLNIDGTIDTTFGTNGFIINDINGKNEFTSIEILNDDSIIASGISSINDLTLQIILSKFYSNGAFDTSFGTNGIIITQTNNTNLIDYCFDMRLQSDGKIICVGQSGRGFNFNGGTSQPSDMLLLRYNTDGSLDSTFSPSGYITTSFDGNIYNNGRAVAIQNDGKIVIGGDTLNETTGQSFALARYTFDNLATSSFTNNENFKITPNPTHDLVTILGNQKIEQISIIDCTGKIVFNNKTNENKIDVSELQNGIYFVKIVANDKVFQQKIVKE